MPEENDLSKIQASQGPAQDASGDSGLAIMGQLVSSINLLNEAIGKYSETMANVVDTSLRGSSRSYAESGTSNNYDTDAYLRSVVDGYLSDNELQQLEASLRRKEQILLEHKTNMENLIRQGGGDPEKLKQTNKEIEEINKQKQELEAITIQQTNILARIRDAFMSVPWINNTMFDTSQFAQTGMDVGLGGVQNFYGRHAASAVSAGLNVKDPIAGAMVNEVTHAISSVTGGLMALGQEIGGAKRALVQFSAAMAGATTMFGLFEAFQGMNQMQNMQKDLLQGVPLAADSISNANAQYGTPEQFYFGMNQHMLGGRGMDEMRKLYRAGMMPEMGGDIDERDPYNLGVMFGRLEDMGVDVGTSSGAARSMVRDLRMKPDEVTYSLAKLANTAKQNGVDMGFYLQKITEVTKSVRSFGYTVNDVDNIFNKFINYTFPNGVKMTQEAALKATEFELTMNQGMSPATAAWVGLNYMSDSTFAPNAAGLSSGGMTSKELVGTYGPAGAMLLSNLMRYGSDSQGRAAAAQAINDVTKKAMGGMYDQVMAIPSEDLRRSMMGTSTAMVASKMLNKDLQYGRSQEESAFIDKIASGEIGMKELEEGLNKFSKDTNTMLKDMNDKFPKLFGDLYTQLQGETHKLDNIKEVFLELKRIVAGVFLPILETIMATVSGIGRFILKYGETGDFKQAFEAGQEETFKLLHTFLKMNHGPGAGWFKDNPIGKQMDWEMFKLAQMMAPEGSQFGHDLTPFPTDKTGNPTVSGLEFFTKTVPSFIGNMFGGGGNTGVLGIAGGYLGINEKQHLQMIKNKFSKGIIQAWCADFASTVYREAGIDMPHFSYVGDMYNWAKSTGRLSSTPTPGSLVMFDQAGNKERFDHVGIVESYDPKTGKINTIEGNTSMPGGGGDGVAKKVRDINSKNFKVIGFVNPGQGAKLDVGKIANPSLLSAASSLAFPAGAVIPIHQIIDVHIKDTTKAKPAVPPTKKVDAKKLNEGVNA